MIKKKKLLSSPSMRKQYFVANNLLGEWGSMQMTVVSEGLLLNSKYIKMAREERGFQALLAQVPLVIVCHELIIWRLTIYGSAMVWNVGAVCHVKCANAAKQRCMKQRSIKWRRATLSPVEGSKETHRSAAILLEQPDLFPWHRWVGGVVHARDCWPYQPRLVRASWREPPV